MTTTTDQATPRSAYDRPAPAFDADLVLVRRGTPGGELLRRYWHPLALSTEATATPAEVRLLGETLLLYRDRSGTVGLLHPRCAHRGTTLLYGKVEGRGIRCCYHGWVFDERGACLEQPCEPGGGLHRDRVVQPWYPVEEHYGLVWAYLGPLDARPPFRRYDVLEDLGPDEALVANGDSIGSGGGEPVVGCNWFQSFENVVDPFHVVVLHTTFTGTQFVDRMAVMPEVTWAWSELGIRVCSDRALPEGRTHRRIAEIHLPNVRLVPDPREASTGRVNSVAWQVPLDDTHHRIFTVFRARDAEDRRAIEALVVNAVDRQRGRTAAERRDAPNDLEAQVGQGEITWHSEEHLATTDRGVTMWRRVFRRNCEAVARGEDPTGADRAAGSVVATRAGSWILEDQPPGIE